MSDKKNCIYSIYGWMGVVGKYTGCFPLPGLYEKKEWSKWTKAFINYVIPGLNIILIFLSVYMASSTHSSKTKNDLTDILLMIINVCVGSQLLLSIALNHTRFRRTLVNYLKLHENVDDLLKLEMKRFVRLFFVLIIAFQTVNNGFFPIGFDMSSFFQLYYTNPLLMLAYGCVHLIFGFLLALAITTHPYLMYIVFQHILKSSFDELLEKIQGNDDEKLSSEMRVMKIRKYTRLYGDLRRLSTQLDHMVSPLMLLAFILHYISEIHSLALITSKACDEHYIGRAADNVAGFMVLFLVSNVAYLTKKSNNELLPALYSTFNSDEKAVKTELETFALQSMYFNRSFSVSGFVNLDRKLIFAIVQSLISQVVVFYKISKYEAKNVHLYESNTSTGGKYC